MSDRLRCYMLFVETESVYALIYFTSDPLDGIRKNKALNSQNPVTKMNNPLVSLLEHVHYWRAGSRIEASLLY